MAWNAFTASRPMTGGRILSKEPNFYNNNLRTVTELSNINIGITETGKERNPFDDWSFLIITYATGDFHVGNSELVYEDGEGEVQTLYFHGYQNFLGAMRKAKAFFPDPEKLLIAGCSAGAFAVPALAGEIAEDFYSSCQDITLLSDSGQLDYNRWQETVKDVWKAKEGLWQSIEGTNLALDWYRCLYQKHGERFRYLYTSSAKDFLLSAYYNDLMTGEFSTSRSCQNHFHKKMREMLLSLHELTPSFHFFIHQIKNPVPSLGGTIHTAVRSPFFYLKMKSGASLASWLSANVQGTGTNEGVRF
ncbi:MAG: pectin acetylesterase [Lachnospiraceae bacterium]|nr:pectin acetylesterase [Lachnospiraceae bacterium]